MNLKDYSFLSTNDNLKELSEEVLNHPYIKKLLKEHKIPINSLTYNDFVDLYRVIETEECKKNCPGIKNCSKPHFATKVAIIEQKLHFVSDSCHQLINHLKMKDNFLFDNSNFTTLPQLSNPLIGIEIFKKGYIYNKSILEESALMYSVLTFLSSSNQVAYFDIFEFSKYLKTINYDFDLIASLVEKIAQSKYLVIANLGLERVSEYLRDDILLPIIQERFDPTKKTLILSIVPLDSLQNHFIAKGEGYNDYRAIRIADLIRRLI